jgi:hypothetical protein
VAVSLVNGGRSMTGGGRGGATTIGSPVVLVVLLAVVDMAVVLVRILIEMQTDIVVAGVCVLMMTKTTAAVGTLWIHRQHRACFGAWAGSIDVHRGVCIRQTAQIQRNSGAQETTSWTRQKETRHRAARQCRNRHKLDPLLCRERFLQQRE